MINLSKIDLQKKTVIDLKKSLGITTQKAKVILVTDFSGSMSPLYKNGSVQKTVERILPFGLAFDDDGEVDYYLFHDEYVRLEENITLQNLDGYIDNKVINKYSMGGTSYAPVLEAIYDKYVQKTGGFLGFGSKVSTMDEPVYIIFITDGDNSDHSETKDIVRLMSNAGFFIKFIGIGKDKFYFLEKLDNLSGRKIDNANFFSFNHLDSVSDSELYSLILKEFPEWVNEARALKLIK